MKKLFNAVFVYACLGLLMGLFYREFTKLNGFTGHTVLGGGHTHALVLGMVFFLLAIALNHPFGLQSAKSFNAWFWCYNVAVLGVLATLATRGILQVLNRDSAMLSHIAGTFHTLYAACIIWFLLILRKKLFKA